MGERFRANKTGELPVPLTEPFEVEVQVPAGYASAKATMLTWEPQIASVPLTATTAGGRTKVRFPGLKLFRTLVLEFEK